MPDENEYLPIKVVIPQEGDLRPPEAGGGPAKLFTDHYDESKESMVKGIDAVSDYFASALSESELPAVARVRLRDDAIAKSHHPKNLFNNNTCPVIGFENFGTLLISVRSDSLQRLSDRACEHSTAVMNDVSKIAEIEPFMPKDAMGKWSPAALVHCLRKTDQSAIKLRIFNHHDQDLNKRLFQSLAALSGELSIGVPESLRYGKGLQLFRIEVGDSEKCIEELAAFVGTQSVDTFEEFSVGTQAIPVARMRDDDMPGPEAGTHYPIVGVFDTGTDPNNAHLQAWVTVRDESEVPRIDQDNTHGSLVAGLIVNGRRLNHDHPGFPSGRARLVDFVAIPSSGKVIEDELVELLRKAFQRHPDVRIWNLSLNSSRRCRNDLFSTFSIALDALQDEYNVMIVNSAGNYDCVPLHSWVRPDLGDDDRILAPAESLRGLTVGSIAHLATNGACAQPMEPSPFSRRGPGAAFVPKPELSHFGGNAKQDRSYSQMGILSLDGSGNIAETIGTSFAAPLVALTAAQLSEMLHEMPARHLLKALLVHSSVLSSEIVTADELPYRGFGKPPSVEEILRCNPWEATLVFDVDLPYSHRHFHKADFPMPSCLTRNGKVYGEVIMTVAYDPPVDASNGAAYSQVNVNASLGMCWAEEGDKIKYDGKVLPYPEGLNTLFEKNQIQHGFKWSPLKVFRKRFQRLNPRDFWRISLEMSTRDANFPPDNQRVALLVTIRDPDRRQPVYNEVVQMMSRSGWITENLRVKERPRVRATA